jgi:hypothetical protein
MNINVILAIVSISVLTFIGIGLYNAHQLKSIHITTSVIILGDKEEIFDMVKYLKNYPKWSPFLAQDPDQKYEVKGTDGTVGAQYHWNGNKGKDLGYQEIVKIEPLQFIGIKCDIQKPFTANPTFDYHFSESSQGIKVTQDFSLESGLVDAFFLWIFGVKSNMEKTNQQGLDLLKSIVEKNS